MPDAQIIDNTGLHRYELLENGETAFLLYSRAGNTIRLIHTEVPETLRGKGMGSRLVGAVLLLARDQKLTVIPLCPFVIEYLKNHSEFDSIIESEHLGKIRT